MAPPGGAPGPYLSIGNNRIEEKPPPTLNAPKNGDKEWIPAAQKKKATVMRLEMADMAKVHGIDSVVTYMLSFPTRIERKEAERRYHSLHTNLFRKIFQCGLHVIERSNSGRLHFHGAAVLHGAEDVRTGFDIDSYMEWQAEQQKGSKGNLGRKKALTRAFGLNATPALKEIWKKMAPAQMKKYGFGLAHVVPILKTPEAAAIYFAKYLSKGKPDSAWAYKEEDKGRRSVRYWGKRRVASVHHSPNTKNSWKWRRRVEFAAKVIGETTRGYAYTHDEFTEYLGKRWCFHLGPWFRDIPLTYIKHRKTVDLATMVSMAPHWPMCKKGSDMERWLLQEYLKFFDG